MKRLFFGLFLGLLLLSSTEARAQQRLLIYGGDEHKPYLGCLNASPGDSESIWNPSGEYGSFYRDNSIWNSYGDFGSPYSSYSPWSEVSTTPPGVYDSQGRFYGHLTRNKAMPQRLTTELAKMMEVFYDMIPKDVSKWYDKLFVEMRLGS